ncbi:hypothetical protein CSPX01_15355 [Colletotrichum filicis]|nr:hypothetical protein CSPX01_15355 [Colletotrichum filicis]
MARQREASSQTAARMDGVKLQGGSITVQQQETDAAAAAPHHSCC